jgi:MFS family permease
MAFRAASGMAAGGMMPLTLAILGDAVSLKYRQVALSRILVFGISGQIAGGVVAGPIAAIAGWRGVLVVCAIAAFLGLVALILAARGAAREVMTRYDPVVALQRYRGIIANPAALPLFAAVAQVLAWVYQLRAAMAGQGAMPAELPELPVPPELDPHNTVKPAMEAAT